MKALLAAMLNSVRQDLWTLGRCLVSAILHPRELVADLLGWA